MCPTSTTSAAESSTGDRATRVDPSRGALGATSRSLREKKIRTIRPNEATRLPLKKEPQAVHRISPALPPTGVKLGTKGPVLKSKGSECGWSRPSQEEFGRLPSSISPFCTSPQLPNASNQTHTITTATPFTDFCTGNKTIASL